MGPQSKPGLVFVGAVGPFACSLVLPRASRKNRIQKRMPGYSLITDGRHGSAIRSLTPLKNRVRARPNGAASLLTPSGGRSTSYCERRSPGMSKPSLHESILRDSLAEELGLTASMRVLPERSTRTNLFQALDSQMQEINAQLTVHPDIEVPKYTRKDFYGADVPRDVAPSYSGAVTTTEPGYRRSPVSLSGEYRPTRSYVDNSHSGLSGKPFPELLQFNQGDISDYNPMGVYSSCSVIKNRALAQSSYNPDLFPDALIGKPKVDTTRVITAPKNNGTLNGPLRYSSEYEHGNARIELGTFDRSATIRTIGNVTQNATSTSRPLTVSTLS